MAYLNAGLWAMGNGMTSVTLVLFFVSEFFPSGFHSRALVVALVIASPRFFGVLRVVAPALIARLRDRRTFCVLTFAASALLLALIPLLACPALRPGASALIATLVVLWGLYHLLEYLAVISLWSWFADLAPARIRGRFVGRRERWLEAGRMFGALSSGGFTYWYNQPLPTGHEDRWIAYALSAAAGAMFTLLAVAPLSRIPSLANRRSARQAPPSGHFKSLCAVLLDHGYRRLLLYECWRSCVNGLTQSAQFLYPTRVLHFQYHELLWLRTALPAGQSAVSPAVGRLIDRIGNRPVLVVSQLLVATGPLFFLLATAETKWILAAAYFVWIAYAGLNVGLPKLMLDLAPAARNAPYISLYYALGGLFNGLGIVTGGVLLDTLLSPGGSELSADETYRVYVWFFAVAVLARALAAWLVARVESDEPPSQAAEPPTE